MNYKKRNDIDSVNILVTTKKYTNDLKQFATQNICYINVMKNFKGLVIELLYRKSKNQLESFLVEKLKNYQKIEVLTPHLMNIPSNYVINMLKKINDKDIIFSNYPDGIAQFYNTRIQFIYGDMNKIEVIKKFFLGIISGIYFKPVHGTIFSQYKPLDYIYSYSKSLIEPKYLNKIKLINYKKMYCIGNNIMFIANANMYETSSISNIIEHINSYNNNFKSIFYKPHPSKVKDKFADYIKLNCREIKIANKNSNLETEFRENKCSSLISIGTFSSSLINLRLIYGHSVNLILIDPLQNNISYRYPYQIRLVKIMNHYNIKILSLNDIEKLKYIIDHD